MLAVAIDKNFLAASNWPPRSLLQNAHRMVVETAVEGEFPVLDRRIWPVWQF